MIALSRLFSNGGVIGFALLLVSLLLASSCESRNCSDVSCTNGVRFELQGGTFDGGRPADTLQINIAWELDNQFVTEAICFLSLTGMGELSCHGDAQVDANFRTIHIGNLGLETIRVTVSAAGNQISQEIFSPNYTSEEVWGPGCGTCTRATITVQLPSS